MKELLEMIARALVDRPEEVKVRLVDGERLTVLELCVHPEDVAKVISRQGRTAEAIRTIFRRCGQEIAKDGGVREGQRAAQEGYSRNPRGHSCPDRADGQRSAPQKGQITWAAILT